jgi:hypothetical protein
MYKPAISAAGCGNALSAVSCSTGANGTACCKRVLTDIDSKYDIVAISHNHFAEIKLEYYLKKQRCFIRTGSYKLEDRFSKQMGYEGSLMDVFKGSVDNVEPRISDIRVTGMNLASKLLELRTDKLYEDQSAGKIASDLSQTAGLSTEKVSDEVLTLPMYPSLTKREMDYIANAINAFFEGAD